MRRATATATRWVSSEVWSARTTSTSFMRWTGLKKCMPITCSGRDVAPAISVIESAEVLVARTAAGGAWRSSAVKVSILSRMSSGTASMTRSDAPAASSIRCEGRSFSKAATAASGATLPSSTPFLSAAPIASTARATAPASTS